MVEKDISKVRNHLAPGVPDPQDAEGVHLARQVATVGAGSPTALPARWLARGGACGRALPGGPIAQPDLPGERGFEFVEAGEAGV
jgi:hypothetical protein